MDDLLGSAPGKKQGELKTRLQAFMQVTPRARVRFCSIDLCSSRGGHV